MTNAPRLLPYTRARLERERRAMESAFLSDAAAVGSGILIAGVLWALWRMFGGA